MGASPLSIACCMACALTLAATQNAGPGSGLAVLSQAAAGPTEESRARDVRSAEFWQPVQAAANEAVQIAGGPHVFLLEDAKVALASLPADNTYVREALRDAMENLRDADEDLAAQAAQSVDAASEHIEARSIANLEQNGWALSAFSPSTWRGFVGRAVHVLMDIGYTAQVQDDIRERQEAMVPPLQQALRGSNRNGGVLRESEVAFTRSFDILKYNLNNANAPKTPDDVREIARKLASASGETRHSFMQLIRASVAGLDQDVQGQSEDAEVTVSRSLKARSLQEPLQGGSSPGSLHAETELRVDTATWLFLTAFFIISALLLLVLSAELWRRPGRQPPSPVEVQTVAVAIVTSLSVDSGRRPPASIKLGSVAVNGGAFLGVCAMVLALDAVGILHRAALTWTLCFGAAGLFCRIIGPRFRSRYLARRKFKTLM